MSALLTLSYFVFAAYFLLFAKWAMARTHVVVLFAAAYFFLTSGARPLLLIWGLDTPAPDYLFGADEIDLIGTTFALVILWTIIFFTSYRLFIGSGTLAVKAPRLPVIPSIARLYACMFFLTICGVGVVGYFILNEGGFTRFMIAVKNEKEFAGLYFLRQFNLFAIMVSIYGLLITAKPAAHGRRKRRISSKPLLIFGGCILINFVTLYAWGYRNQIAFMSAVMLLGYHIFIRRMTLAELTAWVVVGLAVFHGLRFLREIMRAEVLSSNALVLEELDGIRAFSMSMHLVQFDGLMLAVRDIGTLVPVRAGQDFLNGLISWVPRFVLPDRETFFIGGWFRRIYEPMRSNGWPITVVGSWWVNFGFIGILIGPIVSAAAIAIFDRIFCRAGTDPWHLVAGGTIGAFMFNGGFNTGTPQDIVLTFIPIVVLTRLLQLRKAPDSHGMETYGLAGKASHKDAAIRIVQWECKPSAVSNA